MDKLVLTAAAAALASTALSSGTQPELPGFLNSLAPVLTDYGVWAIVLLVFLEDFGVPVPGETVLIAGAVFAGAGQLNIVAVGLAGFIAAVAGDNLGYAIGRFGGRALVDRWGKYVFLTPERLDKAENFFNRHGGKIITIARFIEGLRQANGLIAGIIEMHWLKFVAFNALGAALWVGTWVSVGYFAGQHITSVYNAITAYSLYAAIAAVVVIAAWIFLRVRKRRRSAAEAKTVEKTVEEAVEDAETTADAETAADTASGAGAKEPTGDAGDAGGGTAPQDTAPEDTAPEDTVAEGTGLGAAAAGDTGNGTAKTAGTGTETETEAGKGKPARP
jgi:membrane protein DedA with SNARE-associated domain